MSAHTTIDVAVTCIDCHRPIESGLDGDEMVDCTHCGAAYAPMHPDVVPEPSMASIRAANDRASATPPTA